MENSKEKSKKLSGRKKGSLFVKIAPMALAYHANGQGTCCLSPPDPPPSPGFGPPSCLVPGPGGPVHTALGPKPQLLISPGPAVVWSRRRQSQHWAPGGGRRPGTLGVVASETVRRPASSYIQCQRSSLSNLSQALARTSSFSTQACQTSEFRN